MKQSSSHRIPQDIRLRDNSPVQNVSDYIERVNQYLQIYSGNVLVYRGEPQIYEKIFLTHAAEPFDERIPLLG